MRRPAKWIKPSAVDAGEVAGDVPTPAVHFVERAGAVEMEIAGEDGGAVDEEEAAVAGGHGLHGVGIDGAHFNAVERAANGAVPEVAGTADGDNRRAFGDAVPLGDDGVGRHFLRAGKERLGAFLRAGDDDAQRAELLRLRGVEDVTEERRRGEQERGLAGLDLAHEASSVGGIGVVNDADAADERQDDVGGHAEAVERWEESEDDVAAGEAERGGAGADNTDDVAMRERDGPWALFRSQR